MEKLFGSADIQVCRERLHSLRSVWSDKTPMKVSLMCRTCSDRQRKPVYVAYGTEMGSFGAWRPRPVDVQPDLQAELTD